MRYLLIFIGSGLGGMLRYLLSTTLQNTTNGWIFPIGTFGVNLIGCFLIGFLGRIAETTTFLQGDGRIFVFVGLLGGFTTFSSFGFETFQLLQDSEYLHAAGNVLGQVGLGTLLVWFGYMAARLL